jgi:hypothetical protein
MLQTSHQMGGPAVVMMPSQAVMTRDGLSPLAMANYLLETNPLSARCFALEMQKQAAWANEAWGEYWGDVAQLV